MVLQMSRPHKNPKSGVYYFRQKTPADLRAIFGTAEVSRSLHTKNAEEAKERHAEESRKQALIWQALRAVPSSIPHKQLVAIAGDYYRSMNEIVEDEPGEPALWKAMAEKFNGIEGHPDSLAQWFGVDADRLLSERGLAADAFSRQRLCEELSNAWRQWYEFQKARSQGDYSPDPRASRFPTMEAPKGASEAAAKGVSMTALFDLWERDHVSNGKPKKTAEDFRQKVNNLKSFEDRVAHRFGRLGWHMCGCHDHVVGKIARTRNHLVKAVRQLCLAVADAGESACIHAERVDIAVVQRFESDVARGVCSLNVVDRIDAMISQHLHRAKHV